MVFIILLGAAMLTAAFRGFGGEEYVKDFLQGLPGGFWSQFIVVMAVIFVLGFFLDFIEIAVVVVPIVAPILLADPSANITAVWLGVMIGVNIQTSFLTPPFGFALFYLRGVASKAISTIAIYRGVVPFIILQLIALGIVGAFPPLVNYLPNRFYLSSFNAPPPMNPRLEMCVEEYLAETFTQNSDEVAATVDRLIATDTSSLPAKLAKSLDDAGVAARSVLPLLAEIKVAQAELDEATISYASLHTTVREIERDIRKAKEAMKRLKSERQSTDDVGIHAHVDEEMSIKTQDITDLEAQIPAEWDGLSKTFQVHLKTLSKVQRKYRRAMDDSYSGAEDATSIISSGPQLAAFKPELAAVIAAVASLNGKDAAAAIKETEAGLSGVPGANAVKSLMSKSRRAYKKNKTDKGAALLKEAVEQLDSEVIWRVSAMANVVPALLAFQDETKYHIGLRSQDRLPDFLVPRISSCKAAHTNISLQF
jgi:hypothetical protein